MQQKMKVSLSQHFHDSLSFKTILVNTLLDVENPPEFNSNTNIIIKIP